MTPDPAPSSRFRSATVAVPNAPAEQLEALLDDGQLLYERYQELAVAATRAGDHDQLRALAAVAGRATDPHRAYAAQRLAGSLLVADGGRRRAAGGDAEAAFLHTVDLLLPVLDADPHEPALLHLLGVALFELGDRELARRLFEAACELDPEDTDGQDHLRACSERMRTPAPAGATSVAARLDALRPRIEALLERVAYLPARTISLCMIVKDEEEMLPGCLAAAASHVDQVVIVDTGSSDRTREIAAEFGATVVDFAWNGSFSDARNESLRHATGDWILWLDADEYVVDGDGPRLRELARRTWVEGFHIVETHFLGAESGGSASHAPMRMFRRRPQYRWTGTVHEQVSGNLPTWLPGRMRHSDVRVDHFGYRSSVVADRGKHERNLDLLMQQLSSSGRDAFTCFNIGTEHAAVGDWQEARTWFEEALDHARGSDRWQEAQFAPLLVNRATAARRSTGDEAGAIALATEGLEQWPSYTDLVYERALSAHQSGDVTAAIADARRALELGDAPARFVAVSGKGTFQARTLLARLLRATGEVEAARDELVAAITEAPHYVPAVEELADLLLAGSEDPASVSDQLDELLGGPARSAAVSVQLGALFHERGAFEQAHVRYERTLSAAPGHPAALAARADLHLAQGDLRAAWQDGLAIDELHPMAWRGAAAAFLAAAVLGEPELLEEPAARLAAAAALPVGERAVYVAWRRLLEPADPTVSALVPQDQDARRVVFDNLAALIRLEATDAFERLHELVERVVPDAHARHMALADLYLSNRFADMAGEELLACAERFGPDAPLLTGLGKVATIKGYWEDAEIFLSESLQLQPEQPEARRLLAAVREQLAG